MKNKISLFSAVWEGATENTCVVEKEIVDTRDLVFMSEEYQYNDSSVFIDESYLPHIYKGKYRKRYEISPVISRISDCKIIFGETVLYKIDIYELQVQFSTEQNQIPAILIIIIHSPEVYNELISPSEFEKFGIELSPDEWHALSNDEKEKKYSFSVLSTKKEIVEIDYAFSLAFCLQIAINILIAKFGRCNIDSFYK